MPSLISDFVYDIFISYRHNDNRAGWVTEFVKNLQEELAATIKEPVSVYFDSNPYDGLLETHHVDKSLEGKLKCLVFIPIISQTYCDIKSFAWQYEFCAFNKLSKEDQFGREVMLSNGNVSSRILPVKIHELDSEDKRLLENELGGPLRAIEFFYKEPGVNRPLKSIDNKNENQSKTDYHNQVNKVANAIKEIISGILNSRQRNNSGQGETITHVDYQPDGIQDKSIAIMPFVNMSNDPEQEYFSDGISEEIINTIVQYPELKVVGRTSSFSFKGKNEDIRVIGRMLGVTKILEGSVRKSGTRVRITAQLIEVHTGFHLWSKKYDREMNDVFLIQDEIAIEIADQLKITLTGEEAKFKPRKQTSNVEAYQLCFKGRSLYYKRGATMFEAIKCFQNALEIDPTYALASSGLSDTYTMLAWHGYLSPGEAWPKALSEAKNAQKYGPDLAETHNTLAVLSLLYDRKWDAAEREFKKALEINPAYTQARIWYGILYLVGIRKKFDEGREQVRLATENDPLSAYAHSGRAITVSTTDLFEEGIKEANYGNMLDSESYLSHYALGCCYHWSGNLNEAIKEFEISLRISNQHPWSLYALLLAHQKNHQKDIALKLYQDLEERYNTGYLSPTVLAIACAALGKDERALKLAHIACDISDPYLIEVCVNYKDGDTLRSIPGYEQILKRLGL